ncbi:MAG TPA: phosphate ABC transporter permease PstA [Acidimicrobiales bacterium]
MTAPAPAARQTAPVGREGTAILVKGSTRTRRNVLFDTAFSMVLFVATLVGVVALAMLLWSIYDRGWDRLAADPVAFLQNFASRRPTRAGIRAALWGSIWLMGLVALFAVPIGVGAALYLEEFAPRRRLTTIVETNISNLAGVPSVVYGILGLGVFVQFLDLGETIIAGALTLAVMSLPVIIIAGREAIRAVPQSVRLGAYGLGATKWQVARTLVLPAAMPGTLTGTILALSRALGETAPLLVVGAKVSIFNTPSSVDSEFSALPMIIFDWTQRPQREWAYAAAAAIIVLLAVLLAMNAVAIFLRNRYSTRW